jgi:protein TonB
MSTSRRITLAALLVLLPGCGHQPPPAAPPPPARPLAHRPAPAVAPAAPLVPSQRLNYDGIDSYKVDLAEHLVSRNPAHTFFGQLPPMLPAIVVLRITVNADGKLTEAFVQRSRDSQASAVALASLQRGGMLPRPLNLIRAPARSLTFSETFLFNRDYKFQVRSIAGPQ